MARRPFVHAVRGMSGSVRSTLPVASAASTIMRRPWRSSRRVERRTGFQGRNLTWESSRGVKTNGPWPPGRQSGRPALRRMACARHADYTRDDLAAVEHASAEARRPAMAEISPTDAHDLDRAARRPVPRSTNLRIAVIRRPAARGARQISRHRPERLKHEWAQLDGKLIDDCGRKHPPSRRRSPDCPTRCAAAH